MFIFLFFNSTNNILFTNGFQLLSFFDNSNIKLKMSNDYKNMMDQFILNGDYSSEWSFYELKYNINDNNVDYASILKNEDYIIIVDRKYEDVFGVNNLHFIKTTPQLNSKIIDLFNTYHIHFNVHNDEQHKLTINKFFINLTIITFTYLIIVFIVTYFRIIIAINSNKNSTFSIFKKMTLTSNKIVNPSDIKVSFNNVAGCNEAKEELLEVIDFLKNPNKFKNAGAVVPKGVLLEGPPGTGKTLLARATAGEANVNFISASGSEFIEMYVGVGASRIRDLFDDAKKNKPCIIFIDEIDAIGKQRGYSGGNDERDQTLNQLLTNMDGFDKEDDIVVLSSTNRADILDKALLRPGRFDRKIKVGLPDRDGRRDILNVHLQNKKVSRDIDLNIIYNLTPGFSGADLSNLANEAAIMSVRYNSTLIDNKCFMDAYEKITIGLPKSQDNRDIETRKMVAYHESGHAIIAKLFNEFVDVRKVTINANNNGAGGYTLFTPKERFVSFPTKKYMFSSMVIAMAGRAAEIILYEKDVDNLDDIFPREDSDPNVTLGSSSDVRRAMEIGREYISVFGTFDALGAGTRHEEQSEKARGEIDQCIAKLINIAQIKAVEILHEREDDLKILSDKLLKNGSVTGDDVP